MSAGVEEEEGGVDIDRITYLGAKQMKDEKRVRTKSKRREQMSFLAALGQRAATWQCEEIKGCSEGNAKRRCQVATWPRCGKERDS